MAENTGSDDKKTTDAKPSEKAIKGELSYIADGLDSEDFTNFLQIADYLESHAKRLRDLHHAALPLPPRRHF